MRSDPPAAVTEPPAAGKAGGRQSNLTLGWPGATRRALLTVAIALALGEFVSLLFLLGGRPPGISLGLALKEGALLFYSFHHVAAEIISPNLHLPGNAEAVGGLLSGHDVNATVGFALMTGTALVLWLLMRSGRAVADALGGEAMTRGLHGAKVAVPYALMCWAGSWILSVHVTFPDTSPMAIHPSHVASLFWPLALGAAAGFAGGVRSAGPRAWTSGWWQSGRWSRRWQGALSGGAWMLLLGLGLSFAGLVVMALVRPHDAGSYLRAVFAGGIFSGLGLLSLSVLAIPNMATWVLAPAMGSCLVVGGVGTTGPWCFLSYGRYPGNLVAGPTFAGAATLGPAPRAMLLFLVIPAVATVAGGIRAARRTETRTRLEGMGVGALAGVVFAVLFVVAMVLSTVTVRLNGPLFYVATGFWRYGPNSTDAPQLALLWGLLGGVAGGWLGGRRWRRPPEAST